MQEMQECQAWSLGWEDPLEKEMATPVFLPGESHGQRSLVGYSPWGCKELDMTGGATEQQEQIFLLQNKNSSFSLKYKNKSFKNTWVFLNRKLNEVRKRMSQSPLLSTCGLCLTVRMVSPEALAAPVWTRDPSPRALSWWHRMRPLQ